MKLGLVVNVVQSDVTGATNYRLAAAAACRGHEVWVMSTGSFTYNQDGSTGAVARTVPPGDYTADTFLQALKGGKARTETLVLEELDVLLLRNNPAAQRPWAQAAGIHFSRLAMAGGVIVLNDPDGLSRAMTKLYLQNFPEAVRPRTLITRSRDEVARFLEAEGIIIIKPLQGSGGKGIFIVKHEERGNLGEIFKSVARDGYVIAQEYLPQAVDGDTRLFLMNGVPLLHQGNYAAFRRIRQGDDLRSNLHAGGRLRKADVSEQMLRIAELVRPRLVADGMFLVGLDIVGDKLMEINVFAPGGLGSAQKLLKTDFTAAVLDAIERKVEFMASHGRNYSNVELATL